MLSRISLLEGQASDMDWWNGKLRYVVPVLAVLLIFLCFGLEAGRLAVYIGIWVYGVTCLIRFRRDRRLVLLLLFLLLMHTIVTIDFAVKLFA